MTAAVQDRDTQETHSRSRGFPMAAGVKAYAGTLAVIDASGNVKPGITSAAVKCVGVFCAPYDNTGGIAGAVTAEAIRGVFGPFANSASADLIGAADVESPCYIVDDQTLAKTSNSGARSLAGTVHRVEPAGVWVRI